MNQKQKNGSPLFALTALTALLTLVCTVLNLITGMWLFAVLGIAAAALSLLFAFLSLANARKNAETAVEEIPVKPDQNVRLATEQLERMAGGDFGATDLSETDDPLLTAVSRLRETISEMLGSISGDANAVADGSAQASSLSARLSQGIAQQGDTLREIYNSIHSVSETVSKNAGNAREANRFASAAADDVQNGMERMRELLDAMGEISKSTDEISKFIKVIEDIAFQTNLLALNSSVEAARAGEAGKGFAVVAVEVKNLANRSQEAARKTSALIQSCVASVRTGAEKTDATAKALSAASEKTQSITGLIDVISRECDLQNASIGKINEDIARMGGIMQTAGEAAQECSVSVGLLAERSEQMKADLKNLKVRKFVPAAHTDGSESETEKTVSAPKSLVKQEARPAPRPEAKPASAPKSSVKQEVRPMSKPETKSVSAPKSPVKQETRPMPKPEAKPVSVPKLPVKQEAKPALKPEAKPASAPKPPVKQEAKPAPKPEAKPASAPKPPVKQEVKPAPKPEAKPVSAPKPPVKQETRPAPKPALSEKLAVPAVKTAPKTERKTEPMPTAIPEKFMGAQFVDVPDSKY